MVVAVAMVVAAVAGAGAEGGVEQRMLCNMAIIRTAMFIDFEWQIPVLSKAHTHSQDTRLMPSDHYNDVLMGAMASQITSLTIAYPTVYSRHRSKKTSKLRVTGFCDGS